MIISICVEEAIEKLKLLHDLVRKKKKIEGNFFNLKKSLADIILNGKMLNAFLLNGNKAKMSTLSTLIQHCTGSFSQCIRQRKGFNTLYCPPRENYSMIFILNISVGLFLGPLFCSIALFFYFFANTTLS